MAYEQELEQQNEELRDRLTKSENLVAEYTRKYSYSDVIDMYSYCKDNYSQTLIELAHKLLDTDKGEWSPNQERIEYIVEQRNVDNMRGNNHRHIFSLKIEKEKLSFIEKYILFRKTRKYVIVQHENPSVLGGDGYCTSTDKDFISKVKSRCAFHMIEHMKKFNEKRLVEVNMAKFYDLSDCCDAPYVQRTMEYIKQSAKDILT